VIKTITTYKRSLDGYSQKSKMTIIAGKKYKTYGSSSEPVPITRLFLHCLGWRKYLFFSTIFFNRDFLAAILDFWSTQKM